jgi:hypothetical protein
VWIVSAKPGEVVNYAIGALGVVLAAYAIWQTRQGPARLKYRIRRERVVLPTRNKHVGLTFDGQPVPQVNRLTIGFVNAGRQRINQGDLERPVTVEVDGETLILHVEGDAKRVDDHTIEVSVSPLAPGERRIARVHHTGPLETDVTISGEVANLPRGLEGWSKPNTWRDPSAIVALALMLAFWAFIAVAVFNDEKSYPDLHPVLRAVFAIAALPIIVGAVVLLAWLPGLLWKPARQVFRRLFLRRSVYWD